VVETPHGFQLVRAVIGDKRAEDATGSDRAELVWVPDQHELRIRLLDRGEEFREVVGASHPGLVEDHDAVAVEDHRRGAALALVEELRECFGSDTRLPAEHLRRHSGGREPDRVIARGLPGATRGVECARLPRARRTDEKSDALATGEQPAHCLALVPAERRVREHPVDGQLVDDGRACVTASVNLFEDRCFTPKRCPRREARRAVSLDRRRAVSPPQRHGWLRRERTGERDHLRVGEHPFCENLHALATSSAVVALTNRDTSSMTSARPHVALCSSRRTMTFATTSSVGGPPGAQVGW